MAFSDNGGRVLAAFALLDLFDFLSLPSLAAGQALTHGFTSTELLVADTLADQSSTCLLLLLLGCLLLLSDLELLLEVLKDPLKSALLLKHLVHTGLVAYNNVVVCMNKFLPKKVFV